MTNAQKILRDESGTPKEFKEAVWKAICQGMITFEEGARGVLKYEAEWRLAGQEKEKK